MASPTYATTALLLCACARSVAPEPANAPTRTPTRASTTAPQLDATAIVDTLVPCDPHDGTVALLHSKWTAAAHAACEAEKFPAQLSSGAAVGALAVGSTFTLLHPSGLSTLTVKQLGCDPGEEFLAPTVVVRFDADKPVPRLERSFGESAAPQFFAAHAPVHPSARLRKPTSIDLAKPEGDAIRDALGRIGETLAKAGAEQCSEPGKDVELTAWSLAATPRPLVFVRLAGLCDDMDFAVLVDPERNDSLVPIGDRDVLFSTAGLEPRWVVDLDGDAHDELVVDIEWVDDGGEDLVLLHADDGAYAQHDLWSAITP